MTLLSQTPLYLESVQATGIDPFGIAPPPARVEPRYGIATLAQPTILHIVCMDEPSTTWRSWCGRAVQPSSEAYKSLPVCKTCWARVYPSTPAPVTGRGATGDTNR